jgi:hypothetical protein
MQHTTEEYEHMENIVGVLLFFADAVQHRADSVADAAGQY